VPQSPPSKRHQRVGAPGGAAPPSPKRHQPVAAPGGAAPPFGGLTGGIAAGKSQVLAAFARRGAATLSSDALVHELLEEPRLRSRLGERWGEGILSDGSLDRRRVGAIVFERPEELAWLEALLHPLVGERVATWRQSLPAGVPLAVVEVPLLFETGMDALFDATVAVVADDRKRADRAGACGTELLEGRGDRQLSQGDKAARATHVIRNDGSVEQLEAAVERLMPLLAGPTRGPA
jgi:dephospho-CoA kinase